jgi:hypothetical protein
MNIMGRSHINECKIINIDIVLKYGLNYKEFNPIIYTKYPKLNLYFDFDIFLIVYF